MDGTSSGPSENFFLNFSKFLKILFCSDQNVSVSTLTCGLSECWSSSWLSKTPNSPHIMYSQDSLHFCDLTEADFLSHEIRMLLTYDHTGYINKNRLAVEFFLFIFPTILQLSSGINFRFVKRLLKQSVLTVSNFFLVFGEAGSSHSLETCMLQQRLPGSPVVAAPCNTDKPISAKEKLLSAWLCLSVYGALVTAMPLLCVRVWFREHHNRWNTWNWEPVGRGI